MTKPKRAPDEALGDLHTELATVLKDAIKKKDENGMPIAALLNVARQFLKDNKIESTATPGSALGELADELPTFTDEDQFPDTAGPAH